MCDSLKFMKSEPNSSMFPQQWVSIQENNSKWEQNCLEMVDSDIYSTKRYCKIEVLVDTQNIEDLTC